VPLGTANVFAAELGLPRGAAALADTIAFARPSAAWCDSVNGRRFAQMIGVGFDARVVEGVDLRLKRLFGKGAYVLSTLAALARFTPASYRVEIDGAAHDAAGVVIAKGHFYGGRFVVAAEARLDEPLLRVALYGGGGRGDILRYAGAIARNRIVAERDVRILPAREVRVTGPAGEAVQIDGDLAQGLPLAASVAPRPIALLR
jgi:diacylglycerol kinase family enzyme